MRGAKHRTHERDTFSLRVVYSVTTEAYMAQEKEPENKVGVLGCMAQSNDVGHQRLGRSAGISRAGNTPVLSANASPEQVCKKYRPLLLPSPTAKSNGTCASTVARSNGAATWLPASYYKTKSSCRKLFPAAQVPGAFSVIPLHFIPRVPARSLSFSAAGSVRESLDLLFIEHGKPTPFLAEFHNFTSVGDSGHKY